MTRARLFASVAPGGHGPTRRRVLAGVSAFAVGSLTGHRLGARRGTPFTLGVAAGEPAPDGFVLWTRLAVDPLAADGLGGLREPVPVRWEVARDEGMREVVRQGTVEAMARSAHCVHVEVRDLEANRPYGHAFAARGAQRGVGP